MVLNVKIFVKIYLNRFLCLSVSLSLKMHHHNNPIRSLTPDAKKFFTVDSTLESPRESVFEHQSGH